MIKEKTARQILGFTMLIYIPLSLFITNIIIDIIPYIILISGMINHIIHKRKYDKLISNELILFKLAGHLKTSRSYNIRFFLGLSIIISISIWAGFYFDVTFQTKQFLVIFFFNGWILYFQYSEMTGLYKFCPEYIILPGSKVEKTSWDKIDNYAINNARTKIFLSFQDNKTYVYNIRKLTIDKKDELEKHIELRINAVQQCV